MAAGLQQAASELGLSPAQLAEKAIRRYLREEAEDKIDREEEHFRRQHARLLEKYGNSYIAMYNGQVIDTDVDELALFMRVRQKYPLVGVLIKRVRAEVDEVWTVRSLRLTYT